MVIRSQGRIHWLIPSSSMCFSFSGLIYTLLWHGHSQSSPAAKTCKNMHHAQHSNPAQLETWKHSHTGFFVCLLYLCRAQRDDELLVSSQLGVLVGHTCPTVSVQVSDANIQGHHKCPYVTSAHKTTRNSKQKNSHSCHPPPVRSTVLMRDQPS